MEISKECGHSFSWSLLTTTLVSVALLQKQLAVYHIHDLSFSIQTKHHSAIATFNGNSEIESTPRKCYEDICDYERSLYWGMWVGFIQDDKNLENGRLDFVITEVLPLNYNWKWICNDACIAWHDSSPPGPFHPFTIAPDSIFSTGW